MKRPTIKDKDCLAYVEYIENKLKLYEESPLLSSYFAVKTTVDNWNQELQESNVSITNGEHKPMFDMCHKYIVEMRPYLELIEYIRSKMTETEKKSADELISKANFAEKGAMMKR